ncbi:MAG: methyltransferase regulatory domain-containing protein [Pleurocapsa minor GSE-CHR-MK-17-07R]|jgi:methyltransferase-like protein/ubiquinone/menaquinone biosynthesis C-methylase UbiE|nr:methyltransferase regulatory domain-containing protein [Pleurocapsa minor GSE-CHR-MK 17-07R]
MTDSAQNPYDQIIYPEAVFAQTHPDRLAVLAIMMGLSPAPVERARILELGCGTGGNIIPLAYQYPESLCVGVDYAAKQIEIGQSAVDALGLKNIQLLAEDFMDMDEHSLGEFDYIITHGIYSWVPSPVQAKLLEITKRHLAPNGVAYISYNTLPGWRMYGIGRELMLYRTRNITDPKERTEAARGVLKFMADSAMAVEGSGTWSRFMNAYHIAIKSQSDYLATKPDELLFHDELEPNNEAVYFSEFMARANAAGLEFLAESYFPYSVTTNLPPAMQQELAKISGDLYELEQYMDFLRCRTFRQTLLVHSEVKIDRAISPQRISRLYFASNMRRQPPAEGDNPKETKFASPDGDDVFRTEDAFTVACFDLLTEAYPAEYALGELTKAARERAFPYQVPPRTFEADAYMFASNALVAYGRSQSIVDVRATHTPCSIRRTEKPVASRLARYQAATTPFVTNQKHERVTLDTTARALIQLLDGAHDTEALIAAMRAHIVVPAGAPEAEIRENLLKEIEHILAWMARSALLIG